jgi:hypothetical protein
MRQLFLRKKRKNPLEEIIERILQEGSAGSELAIPADFDEVLNTPIENIVPPDLRKPVKDKVDSKAASPESEREAQDQTVSTAPSDDLKIYKVTPMSFSGDNIEYSELVSTSRPSTIIYNANRDIAGFVKFGEKIPHTYKYIYNSLGQLMAQRNEDDTAWIAGASPEAKKITEKTPAPSQRGPIPDVMPFGLTPKPKDWGQNLEGTSFNLGNLYSYKPGGYPDVILLGPAPTIGDLLVRVYSKSATQDPVGSGIGRKLTSSEISDLRQGKWSISDIILGVKVVENSPYDFMEFIKSESGYRQIRNDPDVAYSRFRIFVIEDPSDLAVPVKSATPEGRAAAGRGECALSSSQILDHTWTWMSDEAWDFDKPSDSLDRLIPCVRGGVESIPYAILVVAASALFKNPKIFQYSYAVPYAVFAVYYATRGMWETAASCVVLAALFSFPQLAAKGIGSAGYIRVVAGSAEYMISRAGLIDSLTMMMQVIAFSDSKEITQQEFKEKVTAEATAAIDKIFAGKEMMTRDALIEEVEQNIAPDVLQKINTLHPPM